MTAAFLYSLLVFTNFKVHEYSTLVFVLSLGILPLASVFLYFDSNKFRARFKDIYPDSELKFYQYLILMFFPLTYFGIIFFLCFKENKKSVRTAVPFRYSFCAIVPLICLQLVSPKFSYMFGSPSSYYIVKTLTDTFDVIAYKNKLKDSKNVFLNYQSRVGKMNSTQIILGVAVSASAIINDQKKDPAVKKNKSLGYRYFLRLQDDLKLAHTALENDRFEFSDYSIPQWLHPAGAFEIFLLVGIENQIKGKFQDVMVSHMFGILDDLEKGTSRLPASEQAEFKSKIEKYREYYRNSESTKIMNQKRNEDHFPVK